MKPTLRGIFLTSENAAETAQFYREVAGMELEEIGDASSYVYWKVDKDGLQLAIHDATAFSHYTSPACKESNTTHLYFHIASQDAFLAHLAAQGITPYLQDEVVITVIDPDGRKVMFGTA
ncbi:MAG TPA: VOC family protein [Verrucomicrobiae bacterium]|nr:VOC family protein [Verrucomicrobiae bacterium]